MKVDEYLKLFVKSKKPNINKPPLYDTYIYKSLNFYGLFTKWENRQLMEYHKGLYGYDKNKFSLTSKQLNSITNNPRRSFDLQTIKDVGYYISD